MNPRRVPPPTLTALLVLVVLSSGPGTPAAVLHVDVNSTNATPPYTGWSTAATSIQAAVDVAANGDTVLVTNGVYATGGQKWFDSGTNRLTVTNSLLVQSVNGPAVTLIQGAHGPGTNAVRCALLTGGAVLSGFTLTNGQSGIGNYPQGGGVYCYSSSAMISNCLLVGNLANDSGGGAYRGTLVNCVLKGNLATNSGGGASMASLLDCSLLSNAARNGGGAYSGVLTNCLVAGNSASSGGGVFTLNNDHLYNCTIVSNTASVGREGVYEGVCQNCVVFYNNAPISPNGFPLQVFYSCMTPLQVGPGNLTNAPLFVEPGTGDYHLQSNSPCINSGNIAYVNTSTDLDGNPRVVGGAVDIGAYEYQNPASTVSYAWLLQYGLAMDGTADSADPDGDSMTNWQEWTAGTNPTNASSLLRMGPLTTSGAGVTVSWQSVTNRTYSLQRASDFGGQPAFPVLKSNITGRAGTTIYADTTATNGGPYLYRVGIQP